MTEKGTGEQDYLEDSTWVDASEWEVRVENSRDKFFTKNGWANDQDTVEQRSQNVGISQSVLPRLKAIVLAREIEGKVPEVAPFTYDSSTKLFKNSSQQEISLEDFGKLLKKLPDTYGAWYVLNPREGNFQNVLTQDEIPPSKGLVN